MGSAAIDPYEELWECLTIEGMGWISYRDLTTHLVEKWGFSLGLIPQTMKGLMGLTAKRFGLLPRNRRYFSLALVIRECSRFSLLRRHIFCFLATCCNLVAQSVGKQRRTRPKNRTTLLRLPNSLAAQVGGRRERFFCHLGFQE
jgi:hypothetical protein